MAYKGKGKYSAMGIGLSKLPAISTASSENDGSPPEEWSTAKATEFLGYFSDYGKIQAEIWVPAIVRYFCEYDQEVVERVVDPFNGLPSTLKFLPSLAELKAALEDARMAIDDPGYKVRGYYVPSQEKAAEVRMIEGQVAAGRWYKPWVKRSRDEFRAGVAANDPIRLDWPKD